MTREEAKKALEEDLPKVSQFSPKMASAYKVAISALSTEGEYISKEDISRVLLERSGANESCLSRAGELGIHESERYFANLLFEDGQITSLIEELPSADVRPNIHAHWEDRDGISDFMYCSNCGGKKHYSEKWIGCPYCLADMREPKGEKGTE